MCTRNVSSQNPTHGVMNEWVVSPKSHHTDCVNLQNAKVIRDLRWTVADQDIGYLTQVAEKVGIFDKYEELPNP